MIGHSIGTPVMLQLGSYQFGLSTAAYQELLRRSGYRWASQDRFGQAPARQYTGPESETIELTGVIYAEFRGGTGQLDVIRALAKKGLPQRLIDGTGRLMGRWVIESVEETQSMFAAKGYPRKQEFTLHMSSFPESATSIAAAVLAATKAAGVAVPASTSTSAVGKFAESASSTIGKAVTSMTETLGAVQDKAAELGNAVGPVIAKVQQGVASARSLQAAVASVKQADLSSLGNIQSALYSVMTAASAASNAGSFAASAVKALFGETGAAIVEDCLVACGRAASAAAGIHSQAEEIRANTK